MSNKLTKTERKLVSQGASNTRKNLLAGSRKSRMLAIPVAIAVSKADAVAGPMIPSFELPVLGKTRLTTVLGYAGAGYYMLARKAGVATTTIGLSGLGLVCRAQTA